MTRTADIRRANRQRIIAKRTRIITRVWSSAPPLWIEQPGRIAKYNLKCGCGMCKRERYNRAADKHATRRDYSLHA